MRKKMVVVGIIILVVGVFLFFYGFFSTFWLTKHYTETIPVGHALKLSVPEVDSGTQVHFEYTTSDEVRFYIFDEYNFHKFETFFEGRIWTDYQSIHHSVGKSDSHTFSAPKDDTYWIVLVNTGDNDVSASAIRSIERVWINGVLYFLAISFIPIGIVGIIVGLRAKPKVEQVTSKLLDVLKLYGRMKISELATRFKTSEVDIESALIKLKSKGEPIQFDRETREAIYTPSKEE